MPRASFGLILANRAVVLGAIQARDLIELSQQAEASGAFDTLWVGDSLLAKPRLEAVALLSALAGATSRMRLAVGCMATFVHRHPLLLAQQWASLDVLSGGRALPRGLPGRARRAERRAGARAPGDGDPFERAGGPDGGRHPDPPEGLHRREGLPPGRVLPVRGREDRAAPGPAAVPDLDREQPDRSHLEGRRERLRRGGGARVPAGRPLRGRMDDQQGDAGPVPRAVGAHRADGARGGPQPRRARQRALPQHQHQRGPPAGARGEQDLPRHLLHLQVLARLRRGLDGGG